MPSSKKDTRKYTKDRTIPGFGGDLVESETGTQRRRGTRDRQTPHGITGNWVQDEVGKGRSAPSQETEVDAGTRREA